MVACAKGGVGIFEKVGEERLARGTLPGERCEHAYFRLAVSGSWIAVIEQEDSTVRLYDRTGATWSLRQTLEGPPNLEDFGFQMRMLNRHLAVSSFRGRWPGSDVDGFVAIYARSATGQWRLSQVHAPPMSGPNTGFGTALAFTSDTLFIGAPGATHPLYRRSVYAADVDWWPDPDFDPAKDLRRPGDGQGPNPDRQWIRLPEGNLGIRLRRHR
jgi:hypothetical protein